MLHEYAVEPQAISEDWKTCRYLAELFGFDRGRLLSQFPKKWLPMAIEAAGKLPDIEKKRVIEKLKQLKDHAFVRTGRLYDPSIGTWVENAVHQDAGTPFRAIIAVEGEGGNDKIIVANDVRENHPLFTANHSAKVTRDATKIAAALLPLACCARRALLIDKYYDPFNAKYQRTLKAVLSGIAPKNPGIDFEIHYCEHKHCPDAAAIEREARYKYSGVIPTGMSVKVYRWREKENGMDFHARYLLTERGGISIDAGFSAEGAYQTTDMHLMSFEHSQASLNAFGRETSDYELVAPILQINSTGHVQYV